MAFNIALMSTRTRVMDGLSGSVRRIVGTRWRPADTKWASWDRYTLSIDEFDGVRLPRRILASIDGVPQFEQRITRVRVNPSCTVTQNAWRPSSTTSRSRGVVCGHARRCLGVVAMLVVGLACHDDVWLSDPF
jgi:hypothetical protein